MLPLKQKNMYPRWELRPSRMTSYMYPTSVKRYFSMNFVCCIWTFWFELYAHITSFVLLNVDLTCPSASISAPVFKSRFFQLAYKISSNFSSKLSQFPNKNVFRLDALCSKCYFVRKPDICTCKVSDGNQHQDCSYSGTLSLNQYTIIPSLYHYHLSQSLSNTILCIVEK